MGLASKIFDGQSAESEFESWCFHQFGHRWSDVSYDSYDDSVELHGCDPDLRLSEEQQKYLWSQGFLRCWLNHKDESETHYYDGGNVEGRHYKRGRPGGM